MNSLQSVKSVFVLALTLSATWSGTAFGREGGENSIPAPPPQAPQQQVSQRPTDLLDLPTEVLLMKIAPLLENRSEVHSLACTSHGFLYKLHMRPGHERHSWFQGVAQSLPESHKTKTGAVYTKVLNHPKLGTAWKDPRGLLWSDLYMRSPDGEILQMNWNDAREYCFNLSGDPARIAAVKQRYQDREDYMAAMRAQFHDALLYEARSLYGELIRSSQEFGVIAGCYLPSREELANHGLDLGFAAENSRFSHEVFTENDKYIWSGSAHPTNGRDAYVFDGGYGSVFRYHQSVAEAFRCACSP